MTENKLLKDRIIAESQRLFGQYGYSRIKTDEIAKNLGISKRTLYRIFPSKEAILEEAVNSFLDYSEKQVELIVKRIQKQKGANFFEEIDNLLLLHSESNRLFKKDFYADIIRTAPDIYLKIKNFRELNFRKNFEILFSAGIDTGLIKEEMNKQLVFMLIFESMNIILTSENLSRLPLTFVEVASRIYKIIFNGILTDEGRKFFEDKNCCT